MMELWKMLSGAAQRAVCWVFAAALLTVTWLPVAAHLASEASTPWVWLGFTVYALMAGLWIQAAWSTFRAFTPSKDAPDA